MVSLRAQNYGNEWIDYSKQYWKFPVTADGFYSISYASLASAGIPVSAINPQNIQVFGRGKQCPILISGETDGSFDPGDHIDVFLRRNDGWMDSLIYDEKIHQANPAYSLFNDTAYYFLSIGDVNGLRTGVSTLNNYSDYPQRNYVLAHAEREFHNEYLTGDQDMNGISLPLYEKGEGWFDNRFPKGGSHEVFLPTSNVYAGADAPDALATCYSASASMAIGFPNHHLQVGWGDPLNIVVDSTYYGYQLNRLRFFIPSSSLSGSQMRIVHRSIDDLNVASDYHAVSYVALEYARNLDFGPGNLRFFIDNPDNASFQTISFTSPAQSPRLFVVQDAAVLEIVLSQSDGQWKGVLPCEGQDRLELFLATSTGTVSGITPVTQSGFFTDYVAQNPANAFLIITHPSLMNAAYNYAAWRNSGESQALVANVEELYMQYACGIKKNPLAIRRFCNDMLMNCETAPKHLFLLGKSIHDVSSGGLASARNDPDKYARNLLPTWGYPGSDIAFTAGLAGTLYQPAIPTGRLAANSPQQVLEYLNKVIEHESQPPALWQKNVLHFGGGTIEYEQQMFRGFLNAYKVIASDTCMGARVYSFFKNTTDPIQMNVSDSIQLLINEGASLMTFFGHASSSGFDQNIDSPLAYNNQGKYPLLIGNSCYTGNLHLGSSISASEEFVLVPDRGVIGFLAKTDLGIPGFLDMYTGSFYRHIFQDSYGQSIGYCMKKSIESFQVADNLYRENVAYYFALHGDPAVRLHPHEKPDYSISPSSVYFDPDDITASQAEVTVKVVVDNIGKSTNDVFGVELVRHYPDGTDSSYVKPVSALLNRDTIEFVIPNNMDIAAGLNRFDVLVDYPLDQVAELNDASNNIVTGKEVMVSSGNLFPVLPYDCAVISNPQPVLKASTGFAFEPERNYILQLDTNAHFNSPLFHQTNILSAGGVVEWSMPFALADSMVVYWRCTADSTSPENGYRWRQSSFQYISDKKGWGQMHRDQWLNDRFFNLDLDPVSGEWEFAPTLANLKCEVYGSANNSFEGLSTRYQLNLNVQEYGGYGYYIPALMVAVLDSATFTPWESNYNGANPQYDFGNTMISANARGRTERYFIFQQNDANQLQGFVNMMDAVPDGNYLLVYTWQLAQKDNWDALAPEVYDAFSDLGADEIATAADSLPFIFFMKKGDPESLIQIVGDAPDDYLVLQTQLTGTIGAGSLISTVIGPSAEWDLTEWEWNSQDPLTADSLRVQLHGVRWDGSQQAIVQWEGLSGVQQDLELNIDADEFPFVKMEARAKDFLAYSAPQAHRWHLFYEPVPEAALDPLQGFYINKDSLLEGENLEVAIAIRNISDLPMDSLLVHYQVEDESRVIHPINYSLQKPLQPGEILFDTLVIATSGLAGRNTLFIDVNPLDAVTGRPHQPEQTHMNNQAKINFQVDPDLINPLLDVTFDGIHILNGDIVSANPSIVITLKDENPYFLMNEEADTSRFNVFLKSPDMDYRALSFDHGELMWIPASGANNKCRIDYNPFFTKDGKYSLRVQASDKSGNVSGANDYVVDFEIMNKPTITEVLNYPNPFTTRTQFVFTLTGTEPPDQFKIQIMNVSGDIVREITQAEIGPLRIGRNLTEYWWDGTDEFGDRLANGVYLYRVIARLNGENIELRETAASPYFVRGFGKIYLMR